MEKIHTFSVSKGESSLRLDVYLAGKLKEISRTRIKELIEKGFILLDNRPSKPNHRVKQGETIIARLLPEPPFELLAEEIPLDIIYEDNSIIVINKPRGMTVHPGAGRPSGTLVNALVRHTGLSSIGGPLRPGIVHRLDKDTTGTIVVAKKDEAHMNLSRQFKLHCVKKTYHALVWGRVGRDSGNISLPIGRDVSDRKKISPKTKKPRMAVTDYRVVKRFKWFTLLDVSPKTGRTHQIRVHLASIKHPIVCDPVYGKKALPETFSPGLTAALKGFKGQFLHAVTLGITHPATGAYMEFTSPYPKDMQELLRAVEQEDNREKGVENLLFRRKSDILE